MHRGVSRFMGDGDRSAQGILNSRLRKSDCLGGSFVLASGSWLVGPSVEDPSSHQE